MCLNWKFKFSAKDILETLFMGFAGSFAAGLFIFLIDGTSNDLAFGIIAGFLLSVVLFWVELLFHNLIPFLCRLLGLLNNS